MNEPEISIHKWEWKLRPRELIGYAESGYDTSQWSRKRLSDIPSSNIPVSGIRVSGSSAKNVYKFFMRISSRFFMRICTRFSHKIFVINFSWKFSRDFLRKFSRDFLTSVFLNFFINYFYILYGVKVSSKSMLQIFMPIIMPNWSRSRAPTKPPNINGHENRRGVVTVGCHNSSVWSDGNVPSSTFMSGALIKRLALCLAFIWPLYASTSLLDVARSRHAIHSFPDCLRDLWRLNFIL